MPSETGFGLIPDDADDLLTAVWVVLNNGKDFFADLDKNLFKLASFCTSFKHFGDGRSMTAFIFSGDALSRSAFTLYPKKVPSLIPKAHFLGFNFMFIFWSVLNVSSASLITSSSVRLLITRKHLQGYPQRDSTFQSISGNG
uniref:Uncharacterized protein n=1 Tax=Tanacetum cinerariifolium TaxID=118510 RepID=A0A699JV75_TANCI|nr:hypothetical protein [Tanacetum cinerariifolium]